MKEKERTDIVQKQWLHTHAMHIEYETVQYFSIAEKNWKLNSEFSRNMWTMAHLSLITSFYSVLRDMIFNKIQYATIYNFVVTIVGYKFKQYTHRTKSFWRIGKIVSDEEDELHVNKFWHLLNECVCVCCPKDFNSIENVWKREKRWDNSNTNELLLWLQWYWFLVWPDAEYLCANTCKML